MPRTWDRWMVTVAALLLVGLAAAALWFAGGLTSLPMAYREAMLLAGAGAGMALAIAALWDRGRPRRSLPAQSPEPLAQDSRLDDLRATIDALTARLAAVPQPGPSPACRAIAARLTEALDRKEALDQQREAALRTSNEALQEDVERLQTVLAIARTRQSQTESHLAEERAKREAAEAALQAQQQDPARAEALEAELRLVRQERDDANWFLGEARSQLEAMRQRVERLEQDLARVDDQLIAHADELDDTRRQRDEANWYLGEARAALEAQSRCQTYADRERAAGE